MEAVTIAGLAALAVGGYFSVIDFMTDLGIRRKNVEVAVQKLNVTRRYAVAPQSGIKKMAGMNI
jgi:hypothetical protein